MGSAKFASLVLYAAAKALQGLWMLLVWVADITQPQWHQVIINPWVMLTTCLAAILFLAPRGWVGRWLAIVYLLPLFLAKPDAPKQGEIWFTLLDVGQGLSAVVETANHLLVFDTGAKFGEIFDAGSAVVVPFLQKQGLKKIDILVVSHADNDHSGGVDAILQQFKVANLLASVPKKIKNYHAQFCHAGQHWQWDNVNFTFLYPATTQKGLGNDSSCVLHIQTGNQSILLTGDIEKAAEHYLVAKQKKALSATLLIAPHHGSKTSSSPDFVQAVAPKYVLFATGYRKRYHFPSNNILKRYQQIATTYNTAFSGALSFKLDGLSKLELPEEFRINHKHIWTQGDL